MHYTRLMTTCCWNMKNAPREGHNIDCLATYGPQFRDATLAVTFMDGKTIIYKGVRVCINKPGYDGIEVNGTTVEFETLDVPFTVCGVRQFTYSIDGDL